MNDQRMTTIKLSGQMGKKFGKVHHVHLETNSTAEAVRYLCSQFPEAKTYLMQAKDKGVGFAVWRGKENITEAQLLEPVGNDVIRIAPVIMGSKSGGVLNIILGVVLVVVGVLGSTYGQAFGGGVWGPILTKMGIAMIVGGVVQLLTPVPKGTKNKSVDNEPSYAFNGAVNTQAQGNPVPLLYGRMIVGSAVISAGINAEDYAPATSGINTGGVLGGSPMTGPYDSRRNTDMYLA